MTNITNTLANFGVRTAPSSTSTSRLSTTTLRSSHIHRKEPTMAKNTDHAQDEIVIEALSRSLDRALDRLEEYECSIAQLSVKIATLEDELSDLEDELSDLEDEKSKE